MYAHKLYLLLKINVLINVLKTQLYSIYRLHNKDVNATLFYILCLQIELALLIVLATAKLLTKIKCVY